VIHVSETDPAIDRSDPERARTALEHVRKTGERNGLPLLEGQQPTVFHVMGLSDRAYIELSFVRTAMVGVDGAREPGQPITYVEARDAVRRGLLKVEGPLGVDLELESEEIGGMRVLKGKTMETIHQRLGPKLIMEIGRRIVGISDLDPQ
jgi:hypothetical protein